MFTCRIQPVEIIFYNLVSLPHMSFKLKCIREEDYINIIIDLLINAQSLYLVTPRFLVELVKDQSFREYA